jgi:hypothetical protein
LKSGDSPIFIEPPRFAFIPSKMFSTIHDFLVYLRSLSCLIDLVAHGIRPQKMRFRLPFDEMDKAYSMQHCNGVFENFEAMYEQMNEYRSMMPQASTNAMICRFRNTDNINYALFKMNLKHIFSEYEFAADMGGDKKLNKILQQVTPVIAYIEKTLASQFHVATIFQWFYTDLEHRMNACLYKYEKYRTLLEVCLESERLEDPSSYNKQVTQFMTLLAQCKFYLNEAMEDSSFTELRDMVFQLGGSDTWMNYSRLIALYQRCLLRMNVISYRIQRLYQEMQEAFPHFDTQPRFKEHIIRFNTMTYYHF